jgi:hypothetical protein
MIKLRRCFGPCRKKEGYNEIIKETTQEREMTYYNHKCQIRNYTRNYKKASREREISSTKLKMSEMRPAHKE